MCRLFRDDIADKVVSSDDLAVMERHCGDILSLSSCSQPTYQELRDHLSDFSIFAGRNPMVSKRYFSVLAHALHEIFESKKSLNVLRNCIASFLY